MNLRIDQNFTFTQEAGELIAGMPTLKFSVATGQQLPELTPGDLWSTEETMPHVFIVVRRHFHWVAPDHLQIDFLLGCQPSP